MNKILLYIFAIIFLINQTASAQFSLNLIINYPAPTYLSDWNSTRAGLMTVIFNSPVQATSLVKFRTQLQNSNGAVIGTSNNASSVIYTIRTGSNIFTLDKVLQLENLQITDAAITRRIQTTGKLPTDNYQLCVQILSSTNDADLTKVPACRPFTQVSYQLPFLLTPNDKTWLDANIAQSVITFRWSSLVPMSKESVIYRLQVFEVLGGQQPMQSLRSNQPILNVDIRNTTQYFWHPQLSLKDSIGHIFIWTVQTLDAKGVPISTIDENTQGRSEPRVFGVCNKLNHDKEDTGEDCAAGRKL